MLVDFSAAVLAEQFKMDGRMGIIEHPENLGVTRNGMPGSIWEWPAIKQLVDQEGVQTGAFYQAAWGRPFAKPTRLIFRAGRLGESMALGWPELDKEGKYKGPLPAPQNRTKARRKDRRELQD